jgi:hypothetical protein
MDHKRPTLDLTPEGEFRQPAPTRMDRVLGMVLRYALIAAGVSILAVLAVVSVVALALLLPILIAAAVVGGGILWWRLRKLKQSGVIQTRIVTFRTDR